MASTSQVSERADSVFRYGAEMDSYLAESRLCWERQKWLLLVNVGAIGFALAVTDRASSRVAFGIAALASLGSALVVTRTVRIVNRIGETLARLETELGFETNRRALDVSGKPVSVLFLVYALIELLVLVG